MARRPNRNYRILWEVRPPRTTISQQLKKRWRNVEDGNIYKQFSYLLKNRGKGLRVDDLIVKWIKKLRHCALHFSPARKSLPSHAVSAFSRMWKQCSEKMLVITRSIIYRTMYTFLTVSSAFILALLFLTHHSVFIRILSIYFG